MNVIIDCPKCGAKSAADIGVNPLGVGCPKCGAVALVLPAAETDLFDGHEQPTRPRYTLAIDDAVKWLETLPSKSVDCVITDPAYESLEKHRKVGTTTRLKHSKSSSNDWFDIFPNSRFQELFIQLWRVMKENSHLYVMCDVETMFVIKPIGESVGFKFWKPIIWDKMKIGMGYHYRARCERILFFEKGKRKLNDLSIPDILEVPSIRSKVAYPTEKPVELAEILVKQSTEPGELVLDCFMGSGFAGVAAIRWGRDFIGCDLSEAAATLTEIRLEFALEEQHRG